MKSYRFQPASANSKPLTPQLLTVPCPLPLDELVGGLREDIEALCAEAGLLIMHHVMQEEVRQRLGLWGQQRAHRHGEQNGYVVFGGRKVPTRRPRLRDKEGGEVLLKSYAAFQQDGRMQQAVVRHLTRHCSSRNYAGALEATLEGYGISKSSVSRRWQAATTAQLAALCERPVPQDLIALLIDGQHYAGVCVVVALGVDRAGHKHVLGLWEGATENSTVVTALLSELVTRGLDATRRLLVIIDGAKALRKAVAQVFGELALVQRCRVHKARNVIEHLPKSQQRHAHWRLRAAWSQPSAAAAEAELRALVRWLESHSPSAARSLEEGLEETLTLQRLGINERLCRSLSSTNLIESCFARTGAWTGRVKRWRNAAMVLRWSAAALLAAEKGFRRIRGYEHLNELEAALNKKEVEIQKQAA